MEQPQSTTGLPSANNANKVHWFIALLLWVKKFRDVVLVILVSLIWYYVWKTDVTNLSTQLYQCLNPPVDFSNAIAVTP